MNVRSNAVEGTWRRHRQWSITAAKGRARLDRWRRVNLALLVAGAVLGAVAAQSSWPRGPTATAGGLAAFALALAAIVQQRFVADVESRLATQNESWFGLFSANK